MPNQYGSDSIDEILELEAIQRRDAAAREALGEPPAPAPKPKRARPQSAEPPRDDRR
jgi:hypothetical protein